MDFYLIIILILIILMIFGFFVHKKLNFIIEKILLDLQKDIGGEIINGGILLSSRLVVKSNNVDVTVSQMFDGSPKSANRQHIWYATAKLNTNNKTRFQITTYKRKFNIGSEFIVIGDDNFRNKFNVYLYQGTIAELEKIIDLRIRNSLCSLAQNHSLVRVNFIMNELTISIPFSVVKIKKTEALKQIVVLLGDIIGKIK